MGYDDDECLVCYLIGDGNNPSSGSATLCLGCLQKLSKNGRATGRVTAALRENYDGLTIGSRCIVVDKRCGTRTACICYCECYGADDDQILWRESWPRNEDDDMHDENCMLVKCMNGEGECHHNCDKCSHCDRCLIGAIVVNGTACAAHGGRDQIYD